MSLNKGNILRRPIFWGIVMFIFGAVGWVMSVVLAVISGGALAFLSYVFGGLLLLSMPVAGLLELLRKSRK